MLGGLEEGKNRNVEFFQKHNISPSGLWLAIDLGVSCKFQSVPLVEMGFRVTAIDLYAGLLKELKQYIGHIVLILFMIT